MHREHTGWTEKNQVDNSNGNRMRLTPARHTVAGIGLTGALMIAAPFGANAVPAAPQNPADAELRDADGAVASSVDTVTALIARVAAADQRLQDLEAKVAASREAVNKALVDLQQAKADAGAAAALAELAANALGGAGTDVGEAQAKLDRLAVETFTRGLDGDGGTSAVDRLNRRQLIDRVAGQQREVVDELESARIEQANADSEARAAKLAADERAATAERRHSEAEGAIAAAQREATDQQAEADRVRGERDAAQAELEASRGEAGRLREQRAAYGAWEDQRRAEDAAARSANDRASRERDAAAARSAANELANALAAGVAELELPHTDLLKSIPTGSLRGKRATPPRASTPSASTPSASTPSTSTPSAGKPLSGTGTRDQRVETVIDRAMSQLGVTYAWGGGDANGPTLGIRDGGVADAHGDYRKVGFDCSGLMVYAFAGVGISLPHYTGYQYTAGTQVPVSQMKRGDMLFWGPGASQHVALYLGDGQMLEAPASGDVVKISPVRWGGMTPYAVRMF